MRKHITEIILAEIADALRSAALTQDQLVGIGIAVPGHMDEAAARVISNHNVWQRFDASLIRAHYKLPIVLENNARCMALAGLSVSSCTILRKALLCSECGAWHVLYPPC